MRAALEIPVRLCAPISTASASPQVLPGQWEFQVGPVGPLELGDEVFLARWLLHRLGEVRRGQA